MWGLLGETFRLLVAHANLFTLISLTVWLPGHVLRNYLEFFTPGGSSAQSLRVVLLIQVIFDPLVVSATLIALDRIKQRAPAGYRMAMVGGMTAWGRLLATRLIINCAVAVPAVGGVLIGASGRVGLVPGALLLGLALVILVLLVRYAVVDSVVVLGGGNAVTAWRRAALLTSGQRWQILFTAALLFLVIFSFAGLVAELFKLAPALNHFVVRVMVDCVLAVGQSLFTIALFLFYWRAHAAIS